jgi:hypothetical protein
MLTGWKAFHAAHARPYMVYADLIDAAGRQKKFTLLGALLRALPLRGDYALLPEKELIRIALERDDAARAFADTMQAPKTAREGGWAGQWAFVLDDRTVEKIKAALPAKRGHRAKAAVSSESAEP